MQNINATCAVRVEKEKEITYTHSEKMAVDVGFG